MAKKTEVEQIDYLEVLKKEINKDFGVDVLAGVSSLLDEPRMVIPISPAIDLGIGGGLLEGTFNIFSGPPKHAKTSAALTAAANCQKPECGDREVFYASVEARLKERDLRGIAGLNLDKFHLIQSTPQKILTGQDFLNICEKVLLTHPRCVLIIDSFSALSHPKQMAEGIGTSTRGGIAGYLSQFCTNMANVLPVQKSILIGITHIMANTSGYGAATMEKGGYSIQYAVDMKLRAKKREYVKVNNKVIGQETTWVVEATALNTPPGSEVVSFLRYGLGLDSVYELVKIAADVNLIEKSGSWLTITVGDEEVRAQGQENMVNELRNRPELTAVLEQKLREMFL